MADIKKLIRESKIELQKQEKKVLLPFSYFRQKPGKNVPQLCITASNYWLQVPADKLNTIVEVANMVFDSSLMIDDIEDNSPIRRGLPAAHLVYGTPSTINSGSYAIFLAMKKALSLGHPEAATVFMEEETKIYRGIGIEIYWRENFICPTEEEYYLNILQKNSTRMPLRLMQFFSENKRDYTVLADMIAIYLQIQNDYTNLCDQPEMERKSYADDITAGTFSLPIIHAVRSQPDNSQVMQILRMRTTDYAMKKHCVSLLEECGSIQYTREVLTSLDKQIRAEIDELGGNPLIEMLLDKLRVW